jgi:hypothetical protein
VARLRLGRVGHVGCSYEDDVRTIVRVVSLSLSVALTLGLPVSPSAYESTTAGRMRAALSADRLSELRQEMSRLRSENRWPDAQQQRYLQVCLRQSYSEPSINQRACECELEVMMDRYSTLGALVNDLMNDGSEPDRPTSVLIGKCLASFGE